MEFSRKLLCFSHLLLVLICLYTYSYLDSSKKQQSSTSYQTQTQASYREIHLNSTQITGIRQALWLNGDYQIMSLILPKELLNITMPENHSTITIFAPSDYGVRFDPRVNIHYQIIRSKVEKEDFETGKITTRTKFTTYFPESYFPFSGLVAVTGPREKSSDASINGVMIKTWNLYNDGRVIVHGVEKFFDTHWVEDHTLWGIRWDPTINATVEYVDPKIQEWFDDHPEFFDSGIPTY